MKPYIKFGKGKGRKAYHWGDKPPKKMRTIFAKAVRQYSKKQTQYFITETPPLVGNQTGTPVCN